MLIISIYRDGNPDPYLIMPYQNYRAVRQYWRKCCNSWCDSPYSVSVSRICEPAIDYPLQHPTMSDTSRESRTVKMKLPS